MSYSKLNQYKVMWVMVFFDLPTETKTDRKNAAGFRKKLLKDGFVMFQFSIYMRHCSSHENADLHIQRTTLNLPPQGKVGMLRITDKQFAMMELFYGKKKGDLPKMPQQLTLF